MKLLSLWQGFGALLVSCTPVVAQVGQLGTLPDPLGSVNVVGSCSPAGGLAGACYELNVVTCSEEPMEQATDTAWVKISCPNGNCATGTKGTVVFLSGGSGSIFWDTDLRYGLNIAAAVLGAGYNVVQIAFQAGGGGSGWQNGFAGVPDGPRALACLYGSIVNWVGMNYLQSGTALCGVGHSSGTSAVAYSLATYGFGQSGVPAPAFSMVELTSGPPHGNLVLGCGWHEGSGTVDQCLTTVGFSFGGDAAALIDPSFGNDYCSQCTEHDNPTNCTSINSPQWAKDSVMSSFGWYKSYPTDVHVLYGCLDTSAAAPIGSQWTENISTSKGVPAVSCIFDSGHRVSDFSDGGQKVASDIVQYCALQSPLAARPSSESAFSDAIFQGGRP